MIPYHKSGKSIYFTHHNNIIAYDSKIYFMSHIKGNTFYISHITAPDPTYRDVTHMKVDSRTLFLSLKCKLCFSYEGSGGGGLFTFQNKSVLFICQCLSMEIGTLNNVLIFVICEVWRLPQVAAVSWLKLSKQVLLAMA